MPDVQSKKVILVVDDDDAILRLLKLRLELDGYVMLGERTAPAGIEKVKNTNVAAVLLDLNIGGVNGFDVLVEMRKLKPDLPVIMLTGNHNEEDGKKAFSLGAWDYVTKPIDFNYLKNILSLQAGE